MHLLSWNGALHQQSDPHLGSIAEKELSLFPINANWPPEYESTTDPKSIH